jgi:hypothetical protein
MTIKLEINVSFPKKLATMKMYLKQKQILRCSMQNEIVDCLKSVFPQEKKVRLGFLHFWSFSVAMPIST